MYGQPDSTGGRFAQSVERPACIGKAPGSSPGLIGALFLSGSIRSWAMADKQVGPRLEPGGLYSGWLNRKKERRNVADRTRQMAD